MYKHQLQELAQRSYFNLPLYTYIREGPDHAPRFKATVNFNGEIFETPHYYSTLRQAEHFIAKVALNSLCHHGPSHSFAAKILNESGVYKNLIQEIAQRVGAPLPHYTTYKSGPGHLPIFTGIVELVGITFTGEPAKKKKQAEKNAAMTAWSSLKQLAKEIATEPKNEDELEQITIARALLNYCLKEKTSMSNPNALIPFQKKFQVQNPKPISSQLSPATSSKILPLISQETIAGSGPSLATTNESVRSRQPQAAMTSDNSIMPPQSYSLESKRTRPLKFLSASAVPYVPIRQMRSSFQGIAPPMTMRTIVPAFAVPPHPTLASVPYPVIWPPLVNIWQAVPVFAALPLKRDEPAPILNALPIAIASNQQDILRVKNQEMDKAENIPSKSETMRNLEQLKI